MLADLKYALRQLAKSPGFAITAVVTLALGIGANTAIFSIVNAVLRHPAGVDHPERVAVLHTRYTKFTLDMPYLSVPTYGHAAAQKDLVEAAAITQGTSFNIVRDGRAEHVAAARVSSQWFQVYGAKPIVGRTFTAEEDQPNAGPVVVLSYGFWQRVFGGRANAVGQTLMLDGKPFRVVGVMRSDFAWPRRFAIWIPIALAPGEFDPRNTFNESYGAVVRLRPGVSIQQLNAALSAKMWEDLRRFGGAKYATSAGWSIYVTPLTQFAAGPLRRPLYLLMAVVGLLLLIAAANVAGLLLARASARAREFAIRTALGASAGRMVRQLFVETGLLAILACVAAIAAGPATGRLLLRLVPNNLAAGFVVRQDPIVLAVAAIGAVLTLLIAGMGPAVAMVRRRSLTALHDGGRSATASAQKQRLRRVFVIAEVAAAFLLLACTGLFLVSLRALQRVDPGFNPQGVLTAKVSFAGHDFLASPERQAAFVGGVVQNLESQPGVLAAGAVAPLPFDPDDGGSCSFAIAGRPTGPGDPGPHSQVSMATPGYLRAMQIPLLAGRWIAPGDLATTEKVAVIDARLAKKYWPGQNPIGQHIGFGCGGRASVIVGVVGTVRLTSLEEDTSDGMRYYPFAQGKEFRADFVVRTQGDPSAAAPLVERAVAQADPAQAIGTMEPMETLVADSLAGRRLIVWLLAAFGGLALLLAMVGIYGLISYVTAQRTNEVGVRMALGAQRSDVLRLILGGALGLVVVGLLLGAGASVIASILLRSVFAEFGRGTGTSLAITAGVMLLVGVVAA
ncbi:MAG TPA: ABC transporter permease, partial [Acidobacteriaceae bacterium]|nr:ABC transporter permease [Acidobacteriaceae bacterium]